MIGVLITGASGFLGFALYKHLSKLKEYNLKCAMRKYDYRLRKEDQFLIKNLFDEDAFLKEMKGVDVLIHIAGLAHSNKHCENEFDLINHLAVASIARLAKECGVKQFIFTSTIKVYGEYTLKGEWIKQATEPSPMDPYAKSKRRAELALAHISDNSKMRFTTIRFPLIISEKAKGNLKLIEQTLKYNLPIPLYGIRNQRSIIYLSNACLFISECILNEQTFNTTLLIKDTDISTSQLIQDMKLSINSRSIIFFMPTWFLKMSLYLLGKKGLAIKLFSDLKIDDEFFFTTEKK